VSHTRGHPAPCNYRLVDMARDLEELSATPDDSGLTDGPVFVLPIPAGSRATPHASWITTAGLASAAEDKFGIASVVTSDGVLPPSEVFRRASRLSTPDTRMARRFTAVPEVIKTAVKDLRLAMRARRFRKTVLESVGPAKRLEFVWQRHVPFHRGGLELARRNGCPIVLSVHALAVQEAEQWGIRRPGWGWLVERFGERNILLEADLVACVSEEVAALVSRQGVSDDRIIVTPNGVDLHRFRPTEPDESLRQRLGVAQSAITLGWVGSFRSFHGLDRLFDAMEGLQSRAPSLTLLMVGAGPGLKRARDEVEHRGLKNVVFAGSFPYDRMPEVLSVMDVAVVMGSPDMPFHYSPVKVREYLATGLPVIAARLGELERMLSDGEDAILVDPSDTDELVGAILRLADDRDLRARLGQAARKSVSERGSWDAVLRALRDRLADDDS
jgi:glycosyltransferase involved in cell wall biosynthesis